MLKCVTTSPLPWLPTRMGSNLNRPQSHLLSTMPCTSSKCWSNLFHIIWEEEKDLQPFIIGLFSAMEKAGAPWHCCNRSKEGLVKRLRTWSWTEQQHGFGNTVNKQDTNNQKTPFPSVRHLFCFIYISNIPGSWICYIGCFPLAGELRRLCFQLNGHGSEGSRGLQLSTPSPLWFVF